MSEAVATTYGLTHIDIAVRDPERSLAFYTAVFGMTVWRRSDDGIIATTPGARDLIQFSRVPDRAGEAGGLVHLGFCIRDGKDIDAVVQRAVAAGGSIVTHRDLSTGRPYAKLKDPDGYDVEVYEMKPA